MRYEPWPIALWERLSIVGKRESWLYELKESLHSRSRGV